MVIFRSRTSLRLVKRNSQSLVLTVATCTGCSLVLRRQQHTATATTGADFTGLVSKCLNCSATQIRPGSTCAPCARTVLYSTLSCHTVEAGPRHTTKSDNDDFAGCVKDVYRIVQLKHHESNWQELPKSLARRLERFAGDINPPMVDQELRSKMEQLTNTYAESICDTVQKHIGRKLLETGTAAAARDNNAAQQWESHRPQVWQTYT